MNTEGNSTLRMYTTVMAVVSCLLVVLFVYFSVVDGTDSSTATNANLNQSATVNTNASANESNTQVEQNVTVEANDVEQTVEVGE